MTTVAIIYHSGYGHTQAQASAVDRGAKSAGAATLLIAAKDIDQHWEFVNAADGIIFGAPTYLGSVSAEFKAFMEKTAAIWSKEGWKNKLAAGFTNSGTPSGDKLSTLIQLALFAAQHGMHWVNLGMLPGHSSSSSNPASNNRLGFWLGAAAFSFTDQGPDETPPPHDLATAEHLGRRVAEAARQFNR